MKKHLNGKVYVCAKPYGLSVMPAMACQPVHQIQSNAYLGG